MRVIHQGTIFDARASPPERRFASFISLLRLDNGKWVAAFRAGSSKDSPDEDILIRVSDDEGETWRTTFEGFGAFPAGGRMRGGLLTEVRPGKLMGSFMWVDRSDPTLPLANPETQGILPSKILVAESEDEGHSWSALREVPLAPHRGSASTGEILVLKDGTLVLPYEARKEYHDAGPGAHQAALRCSPDGGRSWGGPVIVAHDPENRLLYWDQRLSVHPDDGRLLAFFWTHDRQAQRDVAMHVAWGSPDAQSWSSPVSTGIAGQICAPLVLPGGRVLAAYVHRHDPPGMRAKLSDDFGDSWNAAEEIVFYTKAQAGVESGIGERRDFGDYWADMNRWTFGHPAVAFLPNGDVLIAHYAGDENAMGVFWVRISLSE